MGTKKAIYELVKPFIGEIKTITVNNVKDDKAGFWKCPYHNSKMCFEVVAELKGIVAE